jgi:hypothetical protein
VGGEPAGDRAETSGVMTCGSLDYARINTVALPALPALCARWLPGGKRVGREYVALNPTRADKRAGSFKVNLASGKWADFATGDKGGDVVSLAAYLFGLRQSDAARRLADALGISGGERHG